MVIMHFSDALVEKYGNQIFEPIKPNLLTSIVNYITNANLRKTVTLRPWIEDQIANPSDKLKEAAKSLKSFKDYDRQVLECLFFVHNKFKYVKDSVTWQMSEYWASANESIMKMKGDCEDGAILMYVLCRLKGIPANRLMIMAGDVDDGKNKGGHCWLAYRPKNYPYNFFFLDWCYWYNGNSFPARNMFDVIGKEVQEFKYMGSMLKSFVRQMSPYKTIWFGFNEEYSLSAIKSKYDK